MSFPNHPPPPPPFLPLPPFAKGDFGHKHGGDKDDEDSNPQVFKRPRSLIKPPSNPSNFPRVNPPNIPLNRGTGYIFYKTRMCLKFVEGNCRNGDQCTFAHGADDLREPPPNWQEIVGRKENTNGYDDQRTIHRFKICKMYANGEQCPYGENCKFLHKRALLNFNPDVDGPRESSAIRISTSGPVMNEQVKNGPVMNVPVMGTRSGPDQIMVADVEKKHVPGSDAFPVNMKPAYWKTRLCRKWELTGYCSFGERCHFAHGQAEQAIRISTSGPVMNEQVKNGPVMNVPVLGTRSGPDQIMVADFENKHVPGSDAFPVNMKPAYWKTRLCSKWELTGYCSFGERCHFAHGQADLQLRGVRIEEEAVNMLSSIPGTKPVFIPPLTTDVNAAPAAPAMDIVRELKIWEKWKGPKKINGIYADWLDGMEPPLMDPEIWRKKTDT